MDSSIEKKLKPKPSVETKMKRQAAAQEKSILETPVFSGKNEGRKIRKAEQPAVSVEAYETLLPTNDEEVPFLIDGKPVTPDQIKEWENAGDISLVSETSPEETPDETGYSPIPVHGFKEPEPEARIKTTTKAEDLGKKRTWLQRLFSSPKARIENDKPAQLDAMLATDSEPHWTDALARETDSERMARVYEEEQAAKEKQEMSEYHQYAEQAAQHPSHHESYVDAPQGIEMDSETGEKNRKEAA